MMGGRARVDASPSAVSPPDTMSWLSLAAAGSCNLRPMSEKAVRGAMAKDVSMATRTLVGIDPKRMRTRTVIVPPAAATHEWEVEGLTLAGVKAKPVGEKMESEKLSLKQQLSKAEKELQAARKEIEKVIIGGIRDTAIFF